MDWREVNGKKVIGKNGSYFALESNDEINELRRILDEMQCSGTIDTKPEQCYNEKDLVKECLSILEDNLNAASYSMTTKQLQGATMFYKGVVGEINRRIMS